MRWLQRPRAPLDAILIVILGAALRIFQLGTESLWVDEAASLSFVRSYDLVGIVFELPLTEPHPPLYYAILELWTAIAGTSPVALRVPSAVFGIGSVGLVYLLGTRYRDRPTGLLAAALLALSRFHIHFAQEARMYSLLTFGTLLSFLAFLEVREEPSLRNRGAWVLSCLLVGSTHLYGLLAVAAQAVYLGVVALRSPRSEPSPVPWGGPFALIGVGLSPWIWIFGRRVLTAGGGIRNLAWIRPPSLLDLLGIPPAYLGLDTVATGAALVVFSCLGWLLATAGALPWDVEVPLPFSSRRLFSLDSRGGGLPAAWLGVVLTVPFVVSWLLFPVFVVRYTVLAAPALLLLLGIQAASMRPRSSRLGVAALLVIAVLVPLPAYYLSDQKEQWDEAAAYVAGSLDRDDVVLVGNHRPGWIETRTAFSYYFDRGDVPVHGLNASLESSQVREWVEANEGVWVVASHFNASDARRIETMLEEASLTKVSQRSFIGIDVEHYVHEPETLEGSSSSMATDGPFGPGARPP